MRAGAGRRQAFALPNPESRFPNPGLHAAVSRIRQHSSSNATPSAAADLGIREWLVLPGAVLALSSQLRPSRARLKSTRAQPPRPRAAEDRPETGRTSREER